MKLNLPGLTRYKLKDGSWAYRVREQGNTSRRVTLPCGPDHPQFHRCYTEARRGVSPRLEEVDTITHSFAWLVQRYEKHMNQQVSARIMNPATKQQRLAFYGRLLPKYGENAMEMPRRIVVRIRDELSATPGAADNMVKALSALYRWALEQELVSSNPTVGVSRINKGTGAIPWSIQDLHQFRERHPKGTMAHLALTLFTFTACRIGDAYRLGRGNERQEDGISWLSWQPEKKGSKPVDIPMLPPLLEAISSQTPAGPTYLLNGHGKPFASKNAFGNWFRDRVIEAGLQERSAHGIRKAAGELLALEGATQYHIMAVHGHGQARTSEVYTSGVNRRRLASEAMARLSGMSW